MGVDAAGHHVLSGRVDYAIGGFLPGLGEPGEARGQCRNLLVLDQDVHRRSCVGCDDGAPRDDGAHGQASQSWL